MRWVSGGVKCAILQEGKIGWGEIKGETSKHEGRRVVSENSRQSIIQRARLWFRKGKDEVAQNYSKSVFRAG